MHETYSYLENPCENENITRMWLEVLPLKRALVLLTDEGA